MALEKEKHWSERHRLYPAHKTNLQIEPRNDTIKIINPPAIRKRNDTRNKGEL